MVKRNGSQTGQASSPVVRVGILVIAFIIWYAAIWSPIYGKVQELKATVSAQETRIFSLERRLRMGRGAGDRLERAEAEARSIVSRSFEASTVQQLASKLQKYVLGKAEEFGATVAVYRTSRPRTFRDHQVAVVNLTITCSSSQLFRLLEALERGDKILRISSLTVSTMRGDPPKLRVNMEVETLFLGEEAV